jgi:hypothetical protein
MIAIIYPVQQVWKVTSPAWIGMKIMEQILLIMALVTTGSPFWMTYTVTAYSLLKEGELQGTLESQVSMHIPSFCTLTW